MNCISNNSFLSANWLTDALLFALTLMFVAQANAATSSVQAAQLPKQNLAAIKVKIVDFLETETIGYPGEVAVHAGAIDPNLRLVQCSDMQVFLPAGSRAWGKTSVGVRCSLPSAWTIYVQATVNVMAQYLLAAAPLAQGSVITAQDILFKSGDLTQLPAGVFTDMNQAIGRTVNNSMTAGTVLRKDMLKLPPVVQRGQTVMVTSMGKGFTVSAEGQAIGNASEGQVVQVKVASGQLISGVARNGGQVEVGF